MNVTVVPTQGQSGPESNGNEGVLHSPRYLELELHHQLQFSVRAKIPLWVGEA